VATSAAEIVAVNWLLLTNVVGLAEPFHSTVEAETKLFPWMVKVKPPLPAATLNGETTLAAGWGTVEGGFCGVVGKGTTPPPPPQATIWTISENATAHVKRLTLDCIAHFLK